MNPTGYRGKIWDGAVIIALIFIAIIGIIYVTDNPIEENVPTNFLLPEDIVNEYEKYIGKDIVLRGYFYDDDLNDDFAYITQTLVEEPIQQGDYENSTYQQREWVLINHSMITISPSNTKYFFHGQIHEVNISTFPLDIVYLQVEKVEK